MITMEPMQIKEEKKNLVLALPKAPNFKYQTRKFQAFIEFY